MPGASEFRSVKTPYRAAADDGNFHEFSTAGAVCNRAANPGKGGPGRLLWVPCPVTPLLNKKGTLNGSECLLQEIWLLGTEDGVLGSFGHAELHDALGGDLNLFARGRIATNACFARY